MKRFKITLKVTLVLGLLAITFTGCEEDPVSIYQDGVPGEPAPIVTAVVPDSNFSADHVTFSGIGVVEITGQNFSPTPVFNTVFFDGVSGEVLSSSTTSIRVKVPKVVGDSVAIRVTVQEAYDFGDYASGYKITTATQEIGGIEPQEQLYSIACDLSETVWVTALNDPTIKIIAIEPDSSFENRISSLTVSSTSLKYGGRDRLFMTGGAILYSMNKVTESVDPSVFITPNAQDATLDIDFVDSTQAFMALRKAPNLGYIMTIDLETVSMDTAAVYDTLTIQSIRIFEDELFVAGYYKIEGEIQPSAVWKNSIFGSTLGPRELVLDLADHPDYTNAQITTITFSEDGKLFIGLNSVNAILVYKDGILKPYYAPILSPPTLDLTWGNGDFLYQLKTNQIIKINTVETGASYGGRF